DGRLLGEPLAHPDARSVDLDAGEAGVGPGEVEELEDAERAAGRLRHRLLARRAAGVGEQQLAGPELALEARADEVERACLGSDDEVVSESPEDEGAE